jgi:hypothetical protein
VSEIVIDAMRPVAADLARCVAARDQAGAAILLQRRSWRDLQALAVILAECASPARIKVVCGSCESCGKSLQPPDGQVRQLAARGLCWSCYRADRKPPAVAACPDLEDDEPRQTAREARMEDLAELLSWGRSLEEAARRVGITERTAMKYVAEMKEQQQEDVAA